MTEQGWHPAEMLRGFVLVSYPVARSEEDAVEEAMGKWFIRQEPATDRWWGPERHDWRERYPERRLDLLRDAFGGWKNPDQEPIFRASLRGISAEIQIGDVLPFHILVVRFDLELSRAAGVRNKPEQLVFLAQKCRDFADKFARPAAAGPAGIITATWEGVSGESFTTLAGMVEERATSTMSGPDSTQGFPPGAPGSDFGRSHVKIANNLQAFVAPMSSSLYNGPGWAVHVVETDLGGRAWGPEAISLIDPMGSSWSAYVDARITGLAALQAVWGWLQSERNDSRRARTRLIELEAGMDRALLWASLRWSWRELYKEEAAARAHAHAARLVRDEYAAGLASFLERLELPESPETWLGPANARKLPKEEQRQSGVLYRIAREVQRDLEVQVAFSEATWRMAEAQKEGYKIRVERVLAFALLIIALLQVAELAAKWWPPIASWMAGLVAAMLEKL